MKTPRTLTMAAAVAALALLTFGPARGQVMTLGGSPFGGYGYPLDLSQSLTSPYGPILYYQGTYGMLPFEPQEEPPGSFYGFYDGIYSLPSYFYPVGGVTPADAEAQQADEAAAQNPDAPLTEITPAAPVVPVAPNVPKDVNGNAPDTQNENVLPRTSDSIQARLLPKHQIYMAWQGDPQTVQQITFAVLDRNRQILARRTIYALPANMTMTVSPKTVYYQVIVRYVNGTMNTVTSPIPQTPAPSR